MSRRRAASAAPRLRPQDVLRSWAADPSARGRETESEARPGGAASGPAAAALIVTRA